MLLFSQNHILLHFDYLSAKDVDELKRISAQNHFVQQEISLQTLHHATIFASIDGCGVWANNTHFCNAWWLYRHQAPQTPKPIAQKKCAQTVVYIGHIHGIWGHYITDHLRFLGFLLHEKFRHLKQYPLAYSVFNPSDQLDENFLFLLKQLGVEKSQLLKITQPTEFEKVILPSECFFYDEQTKAHYFTQDYLNIIQQIMESVPTQKHKEKIYFSRTKLNNQRDFNEIAVETIFKQQGFSIIYPEKTPIEKQLSLLKNAQTFAATEGSIAHNMVFCSDQTTILLLRKARHFISHQIALNQTKAFDIFYIDVSFCPFLPQTSEWIAGPFFLYDSNFLRRYFHLPPRFFPVFLFLKMYGLKEGLRWITHSKMVLALRAKFKIRSRIKKILHQIQSPRSKPKNF